MTDRAVLVLAVVSHDRAEALGVRTAAQFISRLPKLFLKV